MMKLYRLTAVVVACMMLPSCAWMFEDGRRAQKLREQLPNVGVNLPAQEAKLAEARKKYEELKKEVDSLKTQIREREAALRAQQKSVEEDAELLLLKETLKKKQTEQENLAPKRLGPM